MSNSYILYAGLLALFFTQSSMAAITSLPATRQVGMSTASFGTGQTRQNMYNYADTNGGLTGTVQNLTATIYYADPTPGDTDLNYTCGNGQACEQLGTISFQNVLWDGAGQPGNASNLSGGAITMGGFNLTDITEGGNYAFIQIYKDNAEPNGIIDGGKYYGKANYDIPGYNGFPNGWSQIGSQYNYLDIPYDTVNASQGQVSFETALVQYNANTVNILADFTWSYTTGLGTANCFGVAAAATCFGVTSGSHITLQASASQTMLDLYRAQYPGITYNDAVTSAPVPLPGAFWLFGSFIGIYSWLKNRSTLPYNLGKFG
jgi:hypothetical protein